jgi:hypothetical protein
VKMFRNCALLVMVSILCLWSSESWSLDIPYGNELKARTYATDFPVGVGALAPVFVVLSDTSLPSGTLDSFQTYNQADPGGSPFPSAGNVFHAYVLHPTGSPSQYQVTFDSGLLTVPATPTGVVTFPVISTVQSGDMIGFYGQGIPVDIIVTGTDIVGYPDHTLPVLNDIITLGSAEFPIYPQNRTYSFGATVAAPEPATLLLLGLGLVGVARLKRKIGN